MAFNQLEHSYCFSQKHGGYDLYKGWKNILESGHSVNEEWASSHDRRRTSPLFSAVLDESLPLTELLLDSGANLEEHNREGRTVLQEAVILANQDIVQLLLDRGAQVHSPAISGYLSGGTALHLAVAEGLVGIVRGLLTHGADAKARTGIGWSPVDMAILDHQTTVLEILLTSVSPMEAVYSASDAEIDNVQSASDFDDQAVISGYLLEHGVRDAGRSHVLFFHTCLSKAIKKLGTSVTKIEELSSILIRDMDAVLLNEAKVAGKFSWPRNLCGDCDRFEKQDSHNVCKTFEHKADFSSLVSSSDSGCNMCNFFMASLENHWCLLYQIDKKWLTEFGDGPKVQLRVSKTRRGVCEYELIVACGDKIAFMGLGHISKQLNGAVAETTPSDTEGTASDRSMAVAKAWLQQCEDEHPSCRRVELGRLPKRVIEVGSVSTEPRIYVSVRERLPYAALSYCWGPHENIRLLSTNIDAYTRCLPFAALPRTIGDAILVARSLGVKYLWVDSLCILQDSEEDLKQEVSYMDEIYANTWFTIAAKDSPSCTSGLFHRRNWPTSAIIPTEIRMPSLVIQQKTLIRDRAVNARTSCKNRLMALPRHYVYKPSADENTPVLETRAWTLQEELLSPRMLKCGVNELSWTCSKCSCTERNPEAESTASRQKWQYAVKRVLVTGFDNHGNLNRVDKEQVFNYWLEIVEDYLRRKLSKQRDKLAALAGCQRAIGKVLEDFPIGGLWARQFFAPSILWCVDNRRNDNLVISFRCPSWSWAFTSRPVNYIRHPSGTDDSRPWVWHHEVKYYPELVSWVVDDSGLHGIDGHMTVRCKLLREASLDCERYLVKDFLNAPPKSRGGKEAIHFETRHDFEDAAAISDPWLMLVRTNQFIPGTKDRGYKYDIETHLLRLEKTSPDRADFRRIGLVITKSWANKWLSSATEETIRLF